MGEHRRGRPILQRTTNMKFGANAVTIDEAGAVVIGFADSDKNPLNYVLLQYDAADKKSGVYIELNDQRQSGYNLIHRIRFTNSAVLIELTAEGRRSLGSDPVIEIVPSAQIRDWLLVKAKMVRLLNGMVPVE